jgi:lipopolysaccharide export system protein LptC
MILVILTSVHKRCPTQKQGYAEINKTSVRTNKASVEINKAPDSYRNVEKNKVPADLKKDSNLATQKLSNFSLETNYFSTESVYKIIGFIAGKIESTKTIWYFFN